ncbi:MAG: hypothetical protein ACFFDN_26775, partial [Candidatus Hodarchaeota archaeon]
DVSSGFFSYADVNGSIADTTKFLVIQAGSITAFLSAADILDNQSLISDYILPTLNFTKFFLWNESIGQFYSYTDSDGENPNNYLIPSESSLMMRAILNYTITTNNYTYYNLVPCALNHLIENMWDNISFGFFKKYNYNSLSIIDYDKWIQEQILPLIIFCKLSFNKIDILTKINIGLLIYVYNYSLFLNNFNNFISLITILGIIYGSITISVISHYIFKDITIKKVEKEPISDLEKVKKSRKKIKIHSKAYLHV